MKTLSYKTFINRSILTVILVVFQYCTLIGNSCGTFTANNNNDSDTPKKIVRVALLQIMPFGSDIEANLKKGEEYCRKAKASGADIVLFPEMWSIGYSGLDLQGNAHSPEDIRKSLEAWKSKAVSKESAFVTHFQKLAAELGITIVITYLEKRDGLPGNTASVIDSKGNILMTYAKVHTCDFLLTEANCTPGDDFYVCDLPVNGDYLRLGIMICYDREFPESARILMMKGAELILTPNACGLDEQRINQFQSRAYENAAGVAMANYPGPFQNGHSCSFDSNGDKILIANESEGIFIVTFDIEKIRSCRKNTINGNAYRRPQKYGLMVSPVVDTLFKRNNAMGEQFIREKR